MRSLSLVSGQRSAVQRGNGLLDGVCRFIGRDRADGLLLFALKNLMDDHLSNTATHVAVTTDRTDLPPNAHFESSGQDRAHRNLSAGGIRNHLESTHARPRSVAIVQRTSVRGLPESARPPSDQGRCHRKYWVVPFPRSPSNGLALSCGRPSAADRELHRLVRRPPLRCRPSMASTAAPAAPPFVVCRTRP
jgi:hypothetical protein